MVTTIATVADTAEEKFLHYYDRFMPNLKYIMQNALSSDYRMLRGKTIECISLIGLAVGKEKVSVVLQGTLYFSRYFLSRYPCKMHEAPVFRVSPQFSSSFQTLLGASHFAWEIGAFLSCRK